jgi:hypothetical protein
VLRWPWKVSRDERIENNAEGPNVAQTAIAIAICKAFGGGITGCAVHIAKNGVVMDDPAASEVADLDVGELCEQYVFELEIAVSDALGMAADQSCDDLLEDEGGDWFRQTVVLRGILEKLAPGAKIHDQIEILFVGEGFVESDKVGMP